MRLAIGEVLDNGKVNVVETARDPVRLGRDAFSQGRLSPLLIDRAVEGFRTFHESIMRHEVKQIAAIATSAVREADNGPDLISRIREDTGIEVDVIGGAEEARLMHLSRKLDIGKGEAMLVDIGGGSVELVLTSDGRLIDSRSYKLGTVRMLQVLSDDSFGPGRFDQLVQEVARETCVIGSPTCWAII